MTEPNKEILIGSGNIKTTEGFKAIKLKQPWVSDVVWYRFFRATKDAGLGAIVLLGSFGVLWLGTLDFSLVSCGIVLGFSWLLGYLVRVVR